MASHRSVTRWAALALLCCLARKGAEAQKGYPQQPSYPQQPQKPSYPQQPQTPSYPQQPQTPSYPQQPQKPSYPQQPQQPSYPQQPQKPSYPQQPQTPSYPQQPQKPSYPQQPQTPSYPQQPQTPSYPQQPQTPSNPQQPQLSWDFAKPTNPQYPKPQTPPSKPQYPNPQTPPSKPQYPNPQTPPSKPQYPNPQTPPSKPQYPRPQTPQLPGKKQWDDTKTPNVPSKRPEAPGVPTPKSCDVEVASRVPCGASAVSATECEARDCCFDGQSCYFAKGVTVQCTKDGHFIVVVAKDVTLPHIDLETISLLGGGQGCTHVDSNSLFAIYYFPVTACGTVVMEEPGVIMYENRMTSSYEVGVGPLGAITRDSTYELLFQCRYIGTSVETLVVEVLPLDNPPPAVAELGPIRVALRLANGQCATKGCNEAEVAYTSYYLDSDYPVTKILRDPVYVEVQLLEKTDPALVLTLGRCWATTSPNPHSLPQWDILIDGCPYTDDRYLSTLVPVDASSGLQFPSHYRRFIFKMFTFVDTTAMDPLRENVYIHCSTAVCVPGQGVSCEPSCYRKGKRDTEAAEQRKVEPKVVVSSGEVIMTAPQE
uniref:Zona pellucida sperm-binding protein 4 n=1 Tax=Fundulus heteroclitus TaxID=8078 RepID=D5MRY4_FUNHE|nr:zona pellucida sperm-binding protein 4-like precursor [Fundulus heteroclitus]BAJ07536.1 choriogenin H [Fundulus heteroclitus]